MEDQLRLYEGNEFETKLEKRMSFHSKEVGRQWVYSKTRKEYEYNLGCLEITIVVQLLQKLRHIQNWKKTEASLWKTIVLISILVVASARKIQLSQKRECINWNN